MLDTGWNQNPIPKNTQIHLTKGELEYACTHLAEEERVETGPTGEYDERETHGHRQHKAELDGLGEDGMSKVHEDVPGYLLRTERYVAKEPNLAKERMQTGKGKNADW